MRERGWEREKVVDKYSDYGALTVDVEFLSFKRFTITINYFVIYHLCVFYESVYDLLIFWCFQIQHLKKKCISNYLLLRL